MKKFINNFKIRAKWVFLAMRESLAIALLEWDTRRAYQNCKRYSDEKELEEKFYKEYLRQKKIHKEMRENNYKNLI